MIRVDMGTVKDYYRPVAGATLCAMLQSDHQHEWSPDGHVWEVPAYHLGGIRHLGGSRQDWPKTNQNPADQRRFLSFWGGQNEHALGGCCADALSNWNAW